MTDVIFDNNEGFIVYEDEFGDVCTNTLGEVCIEFYNEGSSDLGNLIKEF